jgi:hypothetical protein
MLTKMLTKLSQNMPKYGQHYAGNYLKSKESLAEKAGFEPAVRFEPYTRFPGVHLKPLGHFSGQFLEI